MTKFPRKFLILLAFTPILISLSLFPIFLTLDSWVYSPPSYIQSGEGHADYVNDVDFSQNASYVVTVGKTVNLFAKSSHIPLWIYDSKDSDDTYKVIAISYNGKAIAAGSNDGDILIFEKKSPNPLWKYSTGDQINSIDVSENGKFIAVGTPNEGLFLFNKTNSEPLWNYPIGQKFVEIMLNGSYIIAGSMNILSIFSFSSSIPLWNYTFPNEINYITTNQNGDIILVGCEDGMIYYFNYLNPIPIWSYLATDSVGDVSISSNGQYFIACVDNSYLFFFENSSSFPVWTYQLDNDWKLGKMYISISGNGNYIILNKEKYLCLFHRSNSTPIWKTELSSSRSYFGGDGDPLISYNGDYFATIYCGDLFFYNRQNPILLRDYDNYYFLLFIIGYPAFGIISFQIIYRNQKKNKRRRIVETLIKSSSKIKLEMIMDILDMNEKVFNREFAKWATDFGLEIENDYLIIDRTKIPEIIDVLLRKFKEWEKLGNNDKK